MLIQLKCTFICLLKTLKFLGMFTKNNHAYIFNSNRDIHVSILTQLCFLCGITDRPTEKSV